MQESSASPSSSSLSLSRFKFSSLKRLDPIRVTGATLRSEDNALDWSTKLAGASSIDAATSDDAGGGRETHEETEKSTIDESGLKDARVDAQTAGNDAPMS